MGFRPWFHGFWESQPQALDEDEAGEDGCVEAVEDEEVEA